MGDGGRGSNNTLETACNVVICLRGCLPYKQTYFINDKKLLLNDLLGLCNTYFISDFILQTVTLQTVSSVLSIREFLLAVHLH